MSQNESVPSIKFSSKIHHKRSKSNKSTGGTSKLGKKTNIKSTKNLIFYPTKNSKSNDINPTTKKAVKQNSKPRYKFPAYIIDILPTNQSQTT
jgi:hypothetical protein